MGKFILWFNEIGINDVGSVGGKNASLGEMYRFLTPKGVRIPNGFTITAFAYKHLIKKAGLQSEIQSVLKGLNVHDIPNLQKRGQKIRRLIREANLPEDLMREIQAAYSKLSNEYEKNVDVAVRSSATAEDLPGASFAGQQESFLNVRGFDDLIAHCRRCFASLFTNRAISYREEKGFDHFKIALSIVVQKMVRSDKGSAGVIFTIDTESGFPNVVQITGSFGLGENVVKGVVNPDEFIVFKPTLAKGFNSIISKQLGSKETKLIYSTEGTNPTKNIAVPFSQRAKYCITDRQITDLAQWGVLIEEYYSKKAKKFRPMDIEWALDGISKKLYIVQARPETVQSVIDRNTLQYYVLKKKGKILVTGGAVGDKIGIGKAIVIKNVKQIKDVKPGQVLVTDMTDPDWVPVMKKAAAIVTNRGGRSCHAAIVSRELGIPCVVGTHNATLVIKNKRLVTVSCAEGSTGQVYDGKLPYEIINMKLKELPEIKTKIMVNIGSPDQAFKQSFLPVDGVGLAREEFIIGAHIGIHPLALINYNKIRDTKLKKEIAAKTQGYSNKSIFFIDKLAEGIALIAAAFYPHDVIVRFSDFKSNEYANLIGGNLYEPKEENPMLGWRGASRYYDPRFTQAFGLECKAFLKVRNEMGLTNVKSMVPMCRTVEEGKKVIEEMKKYGLVQGENGLQVYVMCELPSNVLLANEFADIFDGFSIGSNDLTQLTLGLDRDSDLISHIFDERNKAVKIMMKQVIQKAHAKGLKVGICGDSPSTYAEITEFLVQEGIDSISLSPDAVLKTLPIIAKKEKNLY